MTRIKISSVNAWAVAAAASKQCRPLINVPYDDDWRHAMVPVLVTRALRDTFGIPSA